MGPRARHMLHCPTELYTHTSGRDLSRIWRWQLQLGPCSLIPGSVTQQPVDDQASCSSSSSAVLLVWQPLPNSRGLALDPDLIQTPFAIRRGACVLSAEPGRVTASPSSVLLLHTRLQGHRLAQPLPLPSVRLQGARESSS